MSFQTYAPNITNTNSNGYSWYECNCCPYGYHIDLDFVRYCESINQEADNRTGSIKRRKDRRRQRQSMEVLLGLIPPIIPAVEENFKKISEPKSTMIPFIEDGLDDAIFDFERTLQRSKHVAANNLPDVTAVTALASSTTTTSHQNGPKSELDGVNLECCGMSSFALQNIREQMALSLERTKQLEDQVKLLPGLKAQISALKEMNKNLKFQLKSQASNTIQNLVQYDRQRSQSFTIFDAVEDSLMEKSPPPPPPRKDFGVMCGVLTRNVGVGHQSPNMKNVSTTTFDGEFADKWLQEKVKFLNDRNALNISNKQLMISKNTQTTLPREKRDVGIQFKYEIPPIPTFNSSSQTIETPKITTHVGVLAKVKTSHASIQKQVECLTIGCSDDTINNVFCEKCNVFKRTVCVGPENSEDTHTVPISLSALSLRSKSFNLGEERLNLNAKTKSVTSQTELTNISRSCQINLKVKSVNKSSQSEMKSIEKSTQYENYSSSRYTDTNELIIPKKDVACQAKEIKHDTNDVGCNTTSELLCCSKCDKEKEEVKEIIKKDGGSPIPSRIPRLQMPTTPVEIRKFRRQDTYTKIYSSPPNDDKTVRTSQIMGLSGLDLSPKNISGDTNPLDTVKRNLNIDVSASASSSKDQNGFNSPITKVQVQEIMLPVSESTIFQPVNQKDRKKAVPSKEMQGAMKVLNDALYKNPRNLKNHSVAINIVQQEWFKISSLVTANPLDVEDYLDALEDMSNLILEYVVNMSDSSGNTAMHYAVSHGNFDVVSILLDSKVCDINKQNKAGYTSVMLVSLAEVRSQTHANVVRRLFQLADVNIRAKQHGQTALMLAVSHGRLDMVKMLLEAGADINIQDEDGSTALMCAAEHGHIEIVKHFLMQPDCDSSLTDVDGSNALKIAMEAGHRHIGVLLYAHERNVQKMQGGKLKRTKSGSPKTPSSPLPIRSSHRALTETKK